MEFGRWLFAVWCSCVVGDRCGGGTGGMGFL